jgi:uncharacterized protein (DUF1501 family)
MIGRRPLLAAATAMALPVWGAAARTPGDARLVVVLLRGGLDATSLLPPTEEPDIRRRRPRLAAHDAEGALPVPGSPRPLHRALPTLHALLSRGEALVLVGGALPGEARSHLAAQRILEEGSDEGDGSGWLGRAARLLGAPPAGLGAPRILQDGPAPRRLAARAWPEADPALRDMLHALWRHDPDLGRAFRDDLDALPDDARDPAADAWRGRGRLGPGAAAFAAEALGRALAADLRLGVLEIGGFDTHHAQARRLPARLAAIDATLAGLRAHLGRAWDRTLVLVLPEFGRSLDETEGGGTGHARATAAIVVGGAAAGGRVEAPTVGRPGPDEGLLPVFDLRLLARAALRDHLGLPDAEIERRLLPRLGVVGRVRGIVRS